LATGRSGLRAGGLFVLLGRRLGAGNGAYGLLISAYWIVDEVLADTACPTCWTTMSSPAPTACPFSISLGGIGVVSLIAGPLVSLLGVGGALTAIGLAVMLSCAVLVRRP